MFKSLQITLATAALATGLTLAPQAMAGTARVVHGDLDLSSTAGREQLDRRIAVAARRVCAVEAPTGTRIVPTEGLAACLADVRRQVETRLAMKTTGESRGR